MSRHEVLMQVEDTAASLPRRLGKALFLGWMILVLVAVVNTSAVLLAAPLRYQSLQEMCGPNIAPCTDYQLEAPDGIETMQVLGLSITSYAAYVTALLVVSAVAHFAIAAVLAWRKPRDWMALLTAAVLVTLGLGQGTMSLIEQRFSAASTPFALSEFAGLVAYSLFFYLFPNGQFAPKLAKWAFGLSTVIAALLAFAYDFYLRVPLLFFANIFLLALFPIFAQVYRYFRVSTRTERQQTKWLVAGWIASWLVYAGLAGIAHLVPSLNSPSVSGALFQLARVGSSILLLSLVVPLTIGIAILRYRLYDIDVLINKTLVYGTLTGTLALCYFGGIVLLQQFFRLLTGQESQFAIVVSTLAIAALFNPLHHRIQGFIDYRFYRRKYNAQQALAAFNASTRSAASADLENLTGELIRVIEETVQPERAFIWLREPGGKP